jgi:predicted ATP-dependent endonuclease of OLD family
MNLHCIRVKNFRRLKDAHIEFESDISIFVGPNNSGKTSVTQAIHMFVAGSKDRFTIHDFSSDCWDVFNSAVSAQPGSAVSLPRISIDLWFSIRDTDVHRIVDLLPSLKWNGTQVGLRIEFAPTSESELLARYEAAKVKARSGDGSLAAGGSKPWPKSLTEYLEKEIKREYEFKYYILDKARFDKDCQQSPGYVPQAILPEKGQGGVQIVRRLVRVDCLNAQRHLSDGDSGRDEDLSRRFGRFYKNRLKQCEDDASTQQALLDSEARLNEHLAKVFATTLQQIADLGYPGLDNPRLLIRSALDPASIMSDRDCTRVHYELKKGAGITPPVTLPDKYNGLGFKNLIYMVVELLDLHSAWLNDEDGPRPLHLVFVEEPEAHLHVQLQQVFIKKVLEVIALAGEDRDFLVSQLIITTHSPHILFERGFQPVRYFRREAAGDGNQVTEVLNLSLFRESAIAPERDFLERYMKLTHCDLFFADAALLVEGNVERLLMPLMIQKAAKDLDSVYLSVLEIGGAFGHRFRTLLEFLGIPALVITDLDSVDGAGGAACPADTAGAVTSNQTLIQWLPRKTAISDLLSAKAAEKTQEPTSASQARVRVAYQTPGDVAWGKERKAIAGRTFEEAFALQNIAWTQSEAAKVLKLRIADAETLSLADLARKIHGRVNGGLGKTDFALALLESDPQAWTVPSYIAEGLEWLKDATLPEAGKI